MLDNNQNFENNISVEINPLFETMTEHDIISAEMTLMFVNKFYTLPINKIHVFKIITEDYFFELGFTKNNFYLSRNEDKVQCEIYPEDENQNMIFVVRWSPTTLELSINGGKRIKKISTFPTFPSITLIGWARKKSILSQTTFNLTSEFYREIISMFQNIEKQVREHNSYNMFWDISHEKNSSTKKHPKREPDVTKILAGMFHDHALIKNIGIYPEHPTAGGNLDFLFTGNLTDGTRVDYCVEVKHAHSSSLEHGLLVQLPKYMRSKGCEFGLYVVLFFKNKDFPEPKKFDDKTAVQLHLDTQHEGLAKIRNLVLDFSSNKPPSKK
jgi:hypothetical protein